jgi:hypothetical protein
MLVSLVSSARLIAATGGIRVSEPFWLSFGMKENIPLLQASCMQLAEQALYGGGYNTTPQQ